MRIARIVIALSAACVPAFSQGLTTIQDTLFKADGTRFNGSITIQWNTFDAANLGTVVQQSKSVSIVNGNLLLQLAPNATNVAPANTYTVLYQSDGRNQFNETWTVPASSTALKVAHVRTGSLSAGGASAGAQTPIQEADVVGLLTDLDQRPSKGSGYGTGRVAAVNQNGEVETVVGDVADCVRVDGTSGTCGSPVPGFVDGETPGGVVDGANKTFTLANTPTGSSLQLFRNGIYMTATQDYTLTGNAVQFVSGNIPQRLDTLTASYRVDPGSASSIGALSSGDGIKVVRPVQVICSATGTTTTSTTYASLGSCVVPFSALQSGDRIEIRFTLAHTGAHNTDVSGFDVQALFGSTTVLQRHGSMQDGAFVGRMEASVAPTGVQITCESYGTVLPILPSILSAAKPAVNVKIDLRAQLSTAGTADVLTLQNYTVLRYPAN